MLLVGRCSVCTMHVAIHVLYTCHPTATIDVSPQDPKKTPKTPKIDGLGVWGWGYRYGGSAIVCMCMYTCTV